MMALVSPTGETSGTSQSPNNFNTMKSIHLSTHKIKSVYVQGLKPSTKESRNQGKENRS